MFYFILFIKQHRTITIETIISIASTGIVYVLCCGIQHTQLLNSLRRIAVPILRAFVSAACDEPQQPDLRILHMSTNDSACIEPIAFARASTYRSAHTSDHAENYTLYLLGLSFQLLELHAQP